MGKSYVGLIELATKALGSPYMYGVDGKVITELLIVQKAEQYPKQYTEDKIDYLRTQIGKVGYECNSFTNLYIGVERSANGWLNYASKSGDIASMPDIIGVTVHYDNHMGVYKGNGEVIEARSTAHGVVITDVTKRGWKNWAMYSEINYEGVDVMKKGDKGEDVYSFQWACKAIGYDTGKWNDMKTGVPNGCDGSFGDHMVGITKQIQTKAKLKVTGIVDTFTFGVVMDALRQTNVKMSSDLKKSNDSLNVARQQRGVINGYIKTLTPYSTQNP